MIIGHQKQWKFLKNAAATRRLPHGILFYGEEGIGKKTLAIEFAKFLNCQAKNSSPKPCQVCRNCLEIQKRSHPDFFLTEPLGENKEIQISQIRDLIWRLSLRPHSADFKIAVLDQAHLMNQEAQNCFLKILEEPKGDVFLFLVTEYPDSLLPTVLSRLQKIRFSRPSVSEIERYLLSQKISREKIKELISFSFGRPGKVIDFLQDNLKIENQKKIISDLAKISNSEMARRFQYAKNLFLEKDNNSSNNIKEILDVWLRYFRNIFLSCINQNLQKQPESFEKYPLLKIKNIIKTIQSINFLFLKTNINSRLALEILLLNI